VSPMTVSRVINDRPRVSDDTRRRVQGAIAELGYVPNGLARGLIRRSTHAFGVIVPDVGNPFFTLVVRGAEEAAWRAGYHVILCNTQADLERERGYVEDMLAFQVDGVLIAAVSDRSHAHLKMLTRNGVPFVLVDRSVSGFDTDLVQGDSVAGARQLVEHLIGLGHRRIGMITDETSDVSTARDRLRGYREALEAAGIPFVPELVVDTSTVDPRLAYQATLDMLDHVEPPTALFAINNIVVIGVAEAVRARSLEIPRDIAVVCFDDIDYASRFHPFLTAMVQPAETFGTVATQLLLDRLAGRVHERRRLVVLPSDLIVRESCGAQLPVR